MDNGILLKSGTGELEILEFVINNKHYAINIIKVKEVVEVDNLTELPNEHPAISGLILCRNEIITLIDLKYILDGERSSKNKSKVIICEFNQMK
ncbi:chemotaxis protein CheV, partial [Clostridium botulinum C str. Stockholm]